jgi:16S rRNA (guanine527-N7)-methyltransferase
LGIGCSEQQAEAAAKYLALVLEWNQRINLVSSSDEGCIFERHFLDSIQVLASVDVPQGKTLLDIGSGAGFPGAPIKIIRPDLRVSLIESKARKCEFLQEMGKVLSMDNFQVINMVLTRQAKGIGEFDYCLGRAVGSLKTIARISEPVLKQGGMLLIFKTINLLCREMREFENATISKRFSLYKTVQYDLSGLEMKSGLCLVALRRNSA